jgi:hypothetical protein
MLIVHSAVNTQEEGECLMLSDNVRTYIANLPVGTFQPTLRPQDEAAPAVTAVDINKLPDGIVTGSNLIQFPAGTSPDVKASVTLSLLAAQRVASNDHVLTTPDQWIDRHNTVLENLNWVVNKGGKVDSQLHGLSVAVHKAIIPFLTAAFTGGATAGALILAALNNLQSMDQNAPWITLFDQQSRRFDVTEYMFTVVSVKDDQVSMETASARFNATFGTTQVLFFKLSRQDATFQSVSETLSASAGLLTDMNADLKVKLANVTRSFIQSLPDIA